MSYSPHLVYFLDRLAGFSTNIFKLEPQASTDGIGPNKIARFSLPSNALLSTRSFKVFFNATTTGVGARLPANISTLIERVEVSAGGVQLSQGTNFYNTLVNAKAALEGSRCDYTTGHPMLVRSSKFDGENIATQTLGANETYASTNSQTQFCIDSWEGFLGTCEPKILDASILPDLVVTLYWTSAHVLSSCKKADTIQNFTTVPATGASASYTINNLHATIETIGLADSVYDNMVSSMIQQKGFLEIPFKQYFSFSNTHTGSSRFTVATQSLDRIWAAWRADGYDTLGAPVVASGFQNERSTGAIPLAKVSIVNNTITIDAGHGFDGGERLKFQGGPGQEMEPLVTGNIYYVLYSSATVFQVAHTPGGDAIELTNAGHADQFFYVMKESKYEGNFDTQREKYVGKFYKFEEPDPTAGNKLTYQLQLNGAYYPQFAATAEHMYQVSKNSTLGPAYNKEMSLEQYKKTNFVQCIRLNMQDSEFSRTISGLDTRSVSLNGYYLTQNMDNSSDVNLMLFAECTSTLRVGAGRQLEVII
jgi:hypothetical protein